MLIKYCAYKPSSFPTGLFHKRFYLYDLLALFVAVWSLATKDHTLALLTLPPLGWGGEWKEKGKKLLVGDKGSLTEQQTKQTVATIILIWRIYKTNSGMHRATLTVRCPVPSGAATNLPPPTSLTRNPA